jgi:hypothetical protein
MLYFLHIPKTAGRSVRAALEENFPVSAVAPIMYQSDLLPLAPTDLLQYELIAGHFGYGLKRYLPIPIDIITFLRRPIDQALSMFFDHKANGYLENGRTLEDVLDSIDVQRILNIQTRWLACDDLSTRNTGYDLFYEDRDEAIHALSDRALLDKAKIRLASMAVIGIVEQLEPSMALLCDHFGWPVRAQWPRINVRTDKDWTAVTPWSKRRLEHLLNLDEELYEFGRCLFLKALQAKSGEDRNRDRYRDRIRSEPALRSCKVAFDGPLHGFGWQEREILSDGTYARWTGPERVSSLQVRVEGDSDFLLSVFVRRAIVAENIEGLRLRVNGWELIVERLFSSFGSYESILCTAKIPAEAIRGAAIAEVEIEVPRVICPRDVEPGNADDRQLGIMVGWLCIAPLVRSI